MEAVENAGHFGNENKRSKYLYEQKSCLRKLWIAYKLGTISELFFW